jgi:acyl transferase domain-containing protein/phospholipid N-methyltransferase/acyl carrier protein
MTTMSSELDSNIHDGHERRSPEPIAIIGIACRFPGGANNPEAFWQLLRNGVDAISEVPSDRWNGDLFFDPDPATVGKTYSRWGGFVEGIDRFDAQFFGIAPREAAYMDPQQRMLLEICWEAFEDAGRVPDNAGSETGVFVGISTHDYGDLQMKDVYSTAFYANTGGALSIAANRLSYVFNFQGPSLAVDTACSSSLVAVHLACQSLRAGECKVAVVGGVNCVISPETTITFSKGSMLSPDGRCKPFDAQANGYVRGEGAGVVILKPLRQARADGDRIYAVILGTAVNQDGRTVGITLPNAVSQETLLRDTYRQAGVSPHRVFYVEAHGTGTPVGDPLEAAAIGAALGAGRSADSFLRIGSVKSNIGHLEAASGIAGLIKAALILRHREIPATLHLRTPNPKIPFEDLRLKPQHALESFPAGQEGTIVGVNSFGFGGTNAHAVLAEASETAPESATGSEGVPRRDYIVPLSARSSAALIALGKAYETLLTSEPGRSLPLADICFTTTLRRSHHEHRLALVAGSTDELATALQSVLPNAGSGVSSPALEPGRGAKLAFVFTGMGPQWWAMGRELLRDEPVFRAAIEECDALFRRFSNWSVLSEMAAEQTNSRMDRADVAQPANFALQIALAALWSSWGIVPEAVVGHSAGEVASAAISGALSLEDAVRVIYTRGRLQQRAAGMGSMLAVGLAASEASALLSGYESRVSIAAVNSPSSVTLSGETAALQEIARELETKQLFCRLLDVRVPYHSHYMDPLRTELLESLSKIAPAPATIALYSTVTGARADGSEFDAAYWWSNIRQPVNFALAAEQLIKDGYGIFLELGPHPALGRSILELLASRKESGTVLPSLRRDKERRTLLESLGTLYQQGQSVRWSALAPEDGRFVDLPRYQWQKDRHWHEAGISFRHRTANRPHPLLERRTESANPAWTTNIVVRGLPYLEDHCVQGSIVYPAAAYIEMALAAAAEAGAQMPVVLENVEFKRALALPKEEVQQLQFIFDAQHETFGIYSRALESTQAWVLHATGKLQPKRTVSAGKSITPASVIRRCKSARNRESCYAVMKERGLQYGPRFQGLETMWHGNKEALGRIQLPDGVLGGTEGYKLHPALLDACFQVLMGTIFTGADQAEKSGTYLPVRIGRMVFRKSPRSQSLWSYAKLVGRNASGVEGDLVVLDDEGEIVAEISGFACQLLPDARGAGDFSRYQYELRWYAKALTGSRSLRSPIDLPTPSQIAVRAVQPAELNVRFGRRRHYEEVEPELESLCAAYVLEALVKLGWTPRKRESLEVSTFSELLGIAPQHRQLLNRLLEILSEEGLLKKTDAGWTVSQMPKFPSTEKTWARLLETYPDYESMLTLLGRCGSHLAEVLHGDQEPLQLLFPDGSMDDLQQNYQESPYNRVYNYMVGSVAAQIVGALPPRQTIRVLEIGAGTGGTTAHVLPAFQPNRTEYVYTDVSNAFNNFGAQRFGGYPFIEYQVLDIEKDPESQGFAPYSFDVVIASNVLHATKDMRVTLANAKRLLAPDGLLIVMEFTRASRVLDLIFGLLKDWWRFEDSALRGQHPWLSRPGWEALLLDSGFAEVSSLSDFRESGEPFQSVIVARAPRHPVESRSDAKVSEAGRGVCWLIFADRGGVGRSLADRLRERGEAAILVSAGASFAAVDERHFTVRADSPDDMMAVVEAVRGEIKGLVHLWSLDVPKPEESGLAGLEVAQQLGCVSTLNLVQTLARATRSEQPRLWLITRGAQAVGAGTSPILPAQAPVWGLGRVIGNEQPHLRCTLLDLDPDAADPGATLLEEISADDVEQEIAWRDGSRYAARLIRPLTLADAQPGKVRRNGKLTSYRLETSRPGILDSFLLREEARRKPGPDEVEIEVHSAGLNFRDVMKAMGLYPTENGEAIWLGDECAGKIVRVGANVDDLKVGDEVLGIAPGALRKFATLPKTYVFAKPANLSFEEAATIPVVFMTTHYALNHLARLSRGERVLIHAAAGGVGLSALQLARNAGAEIFATAGTPEKREYLKSLGVKHIMDSRSQAFVGEIMEATGGKGVSVVLNSLAGEFIPSGLSVLEATGRFLELGKIDIYQDNKLGLAHFKRGLSFFSVDLGWLMQHRQEFSRSLLKEVMAMFEAGILQPLPVKTFPVSNAAGGFRHMAQAKHIGKIAVSLNGTAVEVTAAPDSSPLFRKNATYLISGGLSGFGLEIGRWLVECGVQHLVLFGRSGIVSPEAEPILARMRETGAHIKVAAADVAQQDQVNRLIDEIGGSMPPLRGIFHAAMVLDDGYLTQLDEKRFARVMAPKVAGAWNLHTATLDNALDYFVCFSSVSSLSGAPGQANYSAANAFLDAFAYYRRTPNLPALTVNWGAIGEVGFVARNADISRYLERQGLESLRPQDAEAALARLLRGDSCEVGVIRGDFKKFAAFYSSPAASRRFSHVLRQESLLSAANGQPREQGEVLLKIREANPEEQFSLMQTLIRQGLASILKTSALRIEPEQPLASYGLDSLMAVELELLVERELGVDVSMGFLAGGGVSLRQLTASLLDQVVTNHAN